MKEPTKKVIAQTVREHIAALPLNGLKLEVIEQGIRRENSCWHVPLRASKEPRDLSRFIMRLAKLECRLEEDEELDIQFEPAGDGWQG